MSGPVSAHRMLRPVAFVAVGLVALIVASTTVAWAAERWIAAPVDDDAIVLLVLGSDAGPNRPGDPLAGRADGFHLLVVSPDHQHVSIVDVPRDAYVPVPGRGNSKINACLVGGPERCVAAAEGLFGVGVDHWLLTDFQGLAAAIDLYGGLTVDVEQRLQDPFSGTDLQSGPQELDGGQVLAYTRDRKSRPGGDFARTASHSTVLTSLHRQIVSEEPSVTGTAELVEILSSTVVSSMDPGTTLRLAYLSQRIPPENVVTRVLGGVPSSAGGASIVAITDAGRATIADLQDDMRLTPEPEPDASE